MKIIEERQSVRKYSDKEIPVSVLKSILNAGRLAPSWMNVQSWKFILVRSAENKELLSKLACNQPHVKTATVLLSVLQIQVRGIKKSFQKSLNKKV